MAVIIRLFQPSDKSALIDLMTVFNQYIQSIDDKKRTDYKEGSSEYFTDKMINLTNTKQGAVYVACDNDTVIGFVSGYVDTQDQDERMETIPAIPGIVGELFVIDKYRGQKIGKQLLASIERYLKDKGCTIVRFPVFAPNNTAREFYRHEGYSERLIYITKDL